MTSPVLTIPAVAAERTRITAPVRTLNALSIDVEEYFHAEAFARVVRREHWGGYEKRCALRLERIAQLLAHSESKATFFVLGWTVDYLAPLLRYLVTQGHEIACHGDEHQHLARMTPAKLRDDLMRARARIEDLVGVSPRGYRAPTFSIMHRTAWALDAVIDAGFEYDSSIFPVRHDRYGVPGAPASPFTARAPSGRHILEFPPLTVGLGPLRIPVGGGGYLRLLPGWALHSAIAWHQRRSEPALLYLHPWELDPDQPKLPQSPLARWRHRVNLARTETKLAALLDAFRFDAVDRVLQPYRLRDDLPEFTV